MALGVTSVIAIASWVIEPSLWIDYVVFLATGTPQVGSWPFPYPIWLRLPLALILVVWGARTGRRWTVVVAAALALPRLYFQSPALLLAVVPLVDWRALVIDRPMRYLAIWREQRVRQPSPAPSGSQSSRTA